MNLLQHINGLFRFGAVGVVNTVVDFSVFAMLALGFDFNLLVANVIAYLVAVTNSFVLNHRFTFKDHGLRSVLAAYVRFVAVNESGIRAELERARLLLRGLDELSAFFLGRKSNYVHAYALMTLFMLASWLVRRPATVCERLTGRQARPGSAQIRVSL